MKSSSAVIYNSSQQVLLAKRSSSKAHDAGLWETIGGKIDSNESAVEALFREIKEELGDKVILKNLQFYKIYNFNTNEISLKSAVYWAEIEGKININKSEISEVRWFNEAEALELNYCVNCKDRVVDFFHTLSKP